MIQLICNFLINIGNATAEDLENIGEAVRKKVLEKVGVSLQWEICRIGVYKNSKIKKKVA